MKVKEIKTKIYVCEVCGAEYEDDETTARRCEKLPVEEQVFKKRDKVEVIAKHSKSGIVGIISAVKVYSPIDNDDLVVIVGVSRKSHFYLYEIKMPGLGAIVTFPACFLKKI